MSKPVHEKQFLDLRAAIEEAKMAPPEKQIFPGVQTVTVTVKALEELLAALDEARRSASKWPAASHLNG